MPSQNHRTQGERFENHYAEFDYEAGRTRQESERQSSGATASPRQPSPDRGGDQARFGATPSAEIRDESTNTPVNPAFRGYGDGAYFPFQPETPRARRKGRYMVRRQKGSSPQYFIGWDDHDHGRARGTSPLFPQGMPYPCGARPSFDPNLGSMPIPHERPDSRAPLSPLHYPNRSNNVVVCNCGNLNSHQGALPVHNWEVIVGAMRYFSVTGNTTCTKEQWQRYMP